MLYFISLKIDMIPLFGPEFCLEKLLTLPPTGLWTIGSIIILFKSEPLVEKIDFSLRFCNWAFCSTEVRMETEIDAFSAQYDEESSCSLIRKSSKLSSLIRNLEVVESTGENGEENCSGGEVNNGIMEDADPSERTRVEEIFSRENKELAEGGSNGHFVIMNSSNGSSVMAMATEATEPDKTQPNAKSEWSVYYEEAEGSESKDFLDKEGEAVDYESKDAELVKDEMVIQTMAKKIMTEVNENQPNVSESIMLNSLGGFERAQDEAQLTDQWMRTLENSTSTGKVEEIVRVLKEQQSHDLLCPACGSCITKRVILRKRKRTSTVPFNRLIQEPEDNAQAPLLEDTEQITEDQNDQPDISHEDTDENEAYGCLACFSIFFRRDKENDSFYCLPFWNPWRDSIKEPSRLAAGKEFSNSLSHQEKESPEVAAESTSYQTSTTATLATESTSYKTSTTATLATESTSYETSTTVTVATEGTSYKTSTTTTKGLIVLSPLENGGSQKTAYTCTEATYITQGMNESGKSSELKEQSPQDQLRELHLDDSARSHAKQEEQEHAKTGAPSEDAFIILPDALPKDIRTSIQDEKIHEDSSTHDQESNNFSAVCRDEELQQDAEVQKDESYKNDYMCSCIPVSNQSVWSIWPFKERINDQLTEPLLPNEELEENLPAVSDESISHGDKESEVTLPLIPIGVESNSLLEKQDLAPLHSQNTEISTNVTVSPVETAIEVERIDDAQTSDVVTTVPDLARITVAQLPATKIVSEWDILKSVVYGGLAVSLTSLGVVSSAAGGEAKTLMVIVMGLANVVAGLFIILNNILDLDHHHPDQFIETVGQRFWFNGFVAIVSYLIFGSLPPITYAFSFRKSDDRLHKFIATSAVSLVCIILLALGKARVRRQSYIRTVIFYIVTGFCCAVAGFFAGEYIKKLLEKWGFKTD